MYKYIAILKKCTYLCLLAFGSPVALKTIGNLRSLHCKGITKSLKNIYKYIFWFPKIYPECDDFPRNLTINLFCLKFILREQSWWLKNGQAMARVTIFLCPRMPGALQFIQV